MFINKINNENKKMLKEVQNMDKKGFVSVHAGMFFVIGLILGAALVYYAATQGWIPLGAKPTP